MWTDSPRKAFQWLSTPLLQIFADFLNAVESKGAWPEAVADVIVHLTPKPSGGRRPIAVLATVARIWERARKPVMRQWAARDHKGYGWAAQGRSAEAAAWTQSLYDEAATQQGLASAAVFFDLTKTFDMIRLEDVWAAGLRARLPAGILRLAMESFAFARRLTFRKEVAEPVHTLSAILAGSGMAQIALAIVLAEPLERIMRTQPQRSLGGSGCVRPRDSHDTPDPSFDLYIRWCIYVDDIAVHVMGSPSAVPRAISETTADVVEALEEGLRMEVSRRHQ